MNSKAERKNIDLVKSYIDTYIQNSRYAKTVKYIESDDDEKDHYLEAIMDCTDYYATITYKCFGTKTGEMYLNIAFSGCDYRFTIYDIFNLFDIKDFDLYFFDNCIEEKRINKSLDKLTSAVENYSSDIKNAGKNISRLIKNRRKDMETIFYENISEEEYYNGDFDYVTKFLKMPRQKALSNLSSRLKDSSLTIYEKRYLKYLNESVTYSGDEKSKGNDFKTARIMVYIPLFLFSVVVCVAGYFILREILFGKNAVVVYVNGLINHGFTPDFVYSIIISVLFVFLGLIRTIGRPIVCFLCSAEEKEIAKAKFSDGKWFLSLLKKIGIPIASFAVASVMLYTVFYDCVGFNDTEMTVPYSDGFSAKYEDIKVYQVENWFNDTGDHFDSSDGYYYIVDYKTDLYDIPIMYKDTVEGDTFTKMLRDHNVQVESVKYVHDIPDIDLE